MFLSLQNNQIEYTWDTLVRSLDEIINEAKRYASARASICISQGSASLKRFSRDPFGIVYVYARRNSHMVRKIDVPARYCSRPLDPICTGGHLAACVILQGNRKWDWLGSAWPSAKSRRLRAPSLYDLFSTSASCAFVVARLSHALRHARAEFSRYFGISGSWSRG